MVGYPSIKIADMENSFDLLYRNIRRITNQDQIPLFIQGEDPEDHIRTCEKEWKRLGYKDERI